MGVVYIAHGPDGRYYVGQTATSIERRRKGHPFAPFTFEQLAELETREELEMAERVWIALLAANQPDIGYNRTAGGRGYRGKPWNQGMRMSAEHRGKLRDGALRKWTRPEYRALMSERHRGKPSPKRGTSLSAEQKEHLRLVNTGKKHSSETKAAQSDAMKRLRTARGENWGKRVKREC